jgi:hypothetical protein
MKKPITISIPKPCQELDQNGTVVNKGIYCASCKKVVTDFTTKTQNEIYDIITQSRGEVCGRFYTHQLNTPIVKHELKTSHFNLKAIAAALASLFGLQVWAGEKNVSPVSITENVEFARVVENAKGVIKQTPEESDSLMIKVQVVDVVLKEPIAGCPIEISKELKFVTDTNGFFEISTDNIFKNIDSIINVRYPGYYVKTFALKELLQQSVIALQYIELIDGMIITSTPKFKNNKKRK